jgi:hypothetical protein
MTLDSLPFQMPGQFYRGNLHTHSTRSDGGKPPAEVMRAYRENGYAFLALTDHFLPGYGYPIVDTREFRDEGFTTLIGAELHAPRTGLGDLWHLVAVGLPLDFAPPSPDETGPMLAARAKGAGAFIGIAHPAWYGLSLEDVLSIDAADAIEVYNATCATLNDRADSWYVSDQLSARGKRLLTYATDDAHFVHRPDVARAWVEVKAERLDPETLLAALKAGHFYSSQGPQLHDVAVHDGRLVVESSPVRAVFLSGLGARAQSTLGSDLTHADFSVDRFAGSYARITIVDDQGRRAWTNPIWIG